MELVEKKKKKKKSPPKKKKRREKGPISAAQEYVLVHLGGDDATHRRGGPIHPD